MLAFRTLLLNHRALALALAALALAMKALLPGGWMPQAGERVITVALCTDASGGEQFHRIALPPTPAHSGKQAGGGDHAKGGACAWSTLAMAALGGADAAVLALALAFILALGFTAAAQPARPRPAYLQPPLRGPPALA